MKIEAYLDALSALTPNQLVLVSQQNLNSYQLLQNHVNPDIYWQTYLLTDQVYANKLILDLAYDNLASDEKFRLVKKIYLVYQQLNKHIKIKHALHSLYTFADSYSKPENYYYRSTYTNTVEVDATLSSPFTDLSQEDLYSQAWFPSVASSNSNSKNNTAAKPSPNTSTNSLLAQLYAKRKIISPASSSNPRKEAQPSNIKRKKLSNNNNSDNNNNDNSNNTTHDCGGR